MRTIFVTSLRQRGHSLETNFNAHDSQNAKWPPADCERERERERERE
jgi:hypothetical protein